MTKKQRRMLVRILVAAAMMIALLFVPVDGWGRFALYMLPYLAIGYDILQKAGLGIVRGRVFDEHFLMAVATIGAIILALTGNGDYTEAVAVMLFYQIGEWFQSYAVGKSRKSIGKLMDIRPDYANVEVDGELTQVFPDEVEVGSLIIIEAGERIPLDGIVERGHSTVDTAALTGESAPRPVAEGDAVISGCINLDGTLHVRTTAAFADSTVSKILDLVENASSRKSRPEHFISKFARIYTPAVCIGALALATVPPLVLWLIGGSADITTWLYRALTFLVISCPCALVVSIPLTFFAGLGGASKLGVLVKGSNYLEALAKADTVVFDKTGTLTKGAFEVVEVNTVEGLEADALLALAAHAEASSSHPIAVSIRAAFNRPLDRRLVSDTQTVSGRGVCCTIGGLPVLVGNASLLSENGVDVPAIDEAGTLVFVAVDGAYAGHILIADRLKGTAPDAIKGLRRVGIRRTVMLTGDSEAVAASVANALGIDEVHAQLLPADKVEHVEAMLTETNGSLVFVGDGINDAPVLSRADIGIAMGGIGSDAAIEAADIVLMDDDPKTLVGAIKLARKCLTIVRQNIVFAIGIKLICLLLGALGLANMWLAIFADVGVMVLAVLNAVRAMFVKK